MAIRCHEKSEGCVVKSRLTKVLGFSPMKWLRDARRMRDIVAAAQRGTASGEPRFAVVVTPWLGTPVPWFSIVSGLLLAADGAQVVFVIDDLPFGPVRTRFRFVVACIRSVAKVLRGRCEFADLHRFRHDSRRDDSADCDVDALSELNAVWALRGEMSRTGRARYVMTSRAQLKEASGAVAAFLQSRPIDVVFVPGGVYGSSGVWTALARRRGIRVASFDSGGYGTLMLAVDGIASQLQDIPRAFTMLNERPSIESERAAIRAAALDEMAKRRGGVDRFASQMRDQPPSKLRFDGAVLIALNSSWDSAALGLHAVFRDSTEWIVETVRYLLTQTAAPVVVRQHPAERLEIARTSDDYRALLQNTFPDHPRLHFVAADEPVNSYDLLAQAIAVVVYTSTIGIEAAAGGKVVITASRSYYADLGFVWKAADRTQYDEHLAQAAAGRYHVTPGMKEDALCCYYLTQCCNWVFSPFNPEGFSEWQHYTLAELAAHEKVRLTVSALRNNVPVAYLTHVARVAAPAAS